MQKQLESLRVALFLDGRYFYQGWQETVPGCVIDLSRLARWLVCRAGGSLLTGAYCYVQDFSSPYAGEFDGEVADFFSSLDADGFSVRKFLEDVECLKCVKCDTSHSFNDRKKIDINIACDMLHLAVTDSYDMAVLVSSDPDYIPVLDTLQFMGKQVYVATWSNQAVSPRTRAAAFGCVNLSRGVDVFARSSAVDKAEKASCQKLSTVAVTGFTGEYALDVFLSELAEAEQQLEKCHSYVGLAYFIHFWRSKNLDNRPTHRRTLLDRLLVENWVETYDVGGGKLALQLSNRARERFQEIAAQG